MTRQAFLHLFADTAFIEEETDDDNNTALILELEPEGDYLQITDDLGFFPASPESSLIAARYTSEGSFCWAKNFKTAQPILELYNAAKTPLEFAALVAEYEPPEV